MYLLISGLSTSRTERIRNHNLPNIKLDPRPCPRTLNFIQTEAPLISEPLSRRRICRTHGLAEGYGT